MSAYSLAVEDARLYQREAWSDRLERQAASAVLPRVLERRRRRSTVPMLNLVDGAQSTPRILEKLSVTLGALLGAVNDHDVVDKLLLPVLLELELGEAQILLELGLAADCLVEHNELRDRKDEKAYHSAKVLALILSMMLD